MTQSYELCRSTVSPEEHEKALARRVMHVKFELYERKMQMTMCGCIWRFDNAADALQWCHEPRGTVETGILEFEGAEVGERRGREVVRYEEGLKVTKCRDV